VDVVVNVVVEVDGDGNVNIADHPWTLSRLSEELDGTLIDVETLKLST
jgi:hypothetical protein